MKIFIRETSDTDAILEHIEALNFVEFTRDGNEVTVYLYTASAYNIASIFVSLTKFFPDLILE